MPFLKVFGIPDEVSTDVLRKLRRNLVAIVNATMSTPEKSVPKNWIRPFFPLDRLGMPETEEDGAATIYVELDTAMFADYTYKGPGSVPMMVVEAVADLVWSNFHGEYEVEVCIVHLDPVAKKLIEAIKLS